jgi:hypothetical protein
MRGSSLWVMALLSVVLMGCGRSPESLIARQIAILDEAGDALASITDAESAELAAPTLSRLQGEINSLVPQVKKLNLTREQREQLEDEHRPDLEAALRKFEEQLKRVRELNLKVGGLSALDDAIAE